MSWLTDLFSVTENSLRRWRERGQVQRVVDVLKEERYKDLHPAALRELAESIAKPAAGTEGPSRDSLVEILADWSERQPSVTLGPLRSAFPGLSSATRLRLIAKLAANRGGRRWLLDQVFDPKTSGELAGEILQNIAPRLEDLDALPRQSLEGQLQSRASELVRTATAGSDAPATLHRLLTEGPGSLRPILVQLSRDHVERRLTAGESLSDPETTLALELARRDKGWVPGLLQKVTPSAALAKLILASTKDSGDTKATLDLVTALYRKLPKDHAVRMELVPRLRELGAPTPLWLELYRDATADQREPLLDALLASSAFSASPPQQLTELLLEYQGRKPTFTQILDALKSPRTEVLEAVFEAAGPQARNELYPRLAGASGLSARFHENRLNDSAESAERRQAGLSALLHASGERGIRQLLERAEPAKAAELRELVLGIVLRGQDPLRSAVAPLVTPLSAEDLNKVLHMGEAEAPAERKLELLRQATSGADGVAVLTRLMTENREEPAKSYLLQLARTRLEQKIFAQRPVLDEAEVALLQDLGKSDLGWFRDLLRRSRQPSVLVEPLMEIAWKIPQSEAPLELLQNFYKLENVGDSERRKILKALLRHRAGVDVFIDLYNDPASVSPGKGRKEGSAETQTLRQRLLQILEEHPRASEIPRNFLLRVLLQELSDKVSRAGVLHILERRNDLSALEDAYALATPKQRQTIYELVVPLPTTSHRFHEKLLLDPQEDPRRRLQAALKLGDMAGRGGLSRLFDQQPPQAALELRRWLVERYLNRATPTLEAASLLKALAPGQPQDLEALMGTSIPARAFEGRVLELGRSATARPGGVPTLIRILREGDEHLRDVAQTLALEHLEQRARANQKDQFEGEDLELAREVGKRLPAEPVPVIAAAAAVAVTVVDEPGVAQESPAVAEAPAAEPVAEVAPAAEEAPAAEAAPVAEEAPAAEPVAEAAPAAEEALAAEAVVEAAPVVEETPAAEPVVEAAPVAEEALEAVAEAVPAVEETPVAEPVVEAAPAVEETPAVEPVAEAAPVAEEALAAEAVAEAAPAVEETPAAEPVAEAAPVVEETPTAEPVAEEAPTAEPVVEAAPAVEETPAAEPVAEAAPVAEEALAAEAVAEAAPAVEETPTAEPVAEEAPTAEPVVEAAPAVEETPAAEPVAEVAPATEEAPAAEAAPAAEEAPAAEPVVEVAPATEEAPAAEAAPAAEEAPAAEPVAEAAEAEVAAEEAPAVEPVAEVAEAEVAPSLEETLAAEPVVESAPVRDDRTEAEALATEAAPQPPEEVQDELPVSIQTDPVLEGISDAGLVTEADEEPVSAEPIPLEAAILEPSSEESASLFNPEPSPFQPEPSPFQPEPTPFVPEPTPFEPEPTPFEPEPSPIQPEPSPQPEPEPRPLPDTTPPNPEADPIRPEPVEPEKEPVEPQREPVQPTPEPVEPETEPIEPQPAPPEADPLPLPEPPSTLLTLPEEPVQPASAKEPEVDLLPARETEAKSRPSESEGPSEVDTRYRVT